MISHYDIAMLPPSIPAPVDHGHGRHWVDLPQTTDRHAAQAARILIRTEIRDRRAFRASHNLPGFDGMMLDIAAMFPRHRPRRRFRLRSVITLPSL